MQIRQVVLFHRDGERRRDLPFRPGRLNIVTGVSESGKSMLIEIVDYCLGAERHGIYDDPITRTIGWYGLELEVDELLVSVARQAPEPGRKSNARAYLSVGDELPPAGSVSQNTSIDEVVMRLAAMVGIEDTLQQSPVETRREPVRATLRNALAYAFQRQYEIANPRALFSGQGDQYVKTSIRDTLPYFLGAVDHDALETRRELARLRFRLTRATAELRAASTSAERVRHRAAGLLQEAATVGLSPGPDLREARPERILEAVRATAEARAPLRGGPLEIEVGAVGDRQDAVAAELRRVRAARRELLRREDELNAFADEVTEQRSRLALLELIPPAEDPTTSRCPFCLAEHAEPDTRLREMSSSLDALGGRLEGAARDRPRLRQAIDELTVREQELREIQISLERELAELARRRDAAAQLRTVAESQAFVRGRLVSFLETTPSVDGKQLAVLHATVEDLEVQVERLTAELSADATRARTTTALNAVGRDMKRWASHLRLQHADGPGIRLDPVRLDVVAETETGETRWLSEDVGAGKNWVGYHVVSLLGLHRFFAVNKRPVPHFLMLDQVSQAFYPPERQHIADRSVADMTGDDRDQVLRIFEALNATCEEMSGRLQIIVTDHADFPEPWFQSCVVQDWWTGEKLVPPEWADDD